MSGLRRVRGREDQHGIRELESEPIYVHEETLMQLVAPYMVVLKCDPLTTHTFSTSVITSPISPLSSSSSSFSWSYRTTASVSACVCVMVVGGKGERWTCTCTHVIQIGEEYHWSCDI